MTSTNLAQALAAMRAFPAEVVQRPQETADALLGYISALAQVKTSGGEAPSVQEACEQLQQHLLGIRQAPRQLSLHEVSLLTLWPKVLEESLQAKGGDARTRLQQLLADSGVHPTSAERATTDEAEAEVAAPPPVVAPADTVEPPKDASNTPKAEPTPLEQALVELAALRETMGPEGKRSLSPDGVMQYAMAVMQIRDEALAAELDALAAACDGISTTLAEVMESGDEGNQADLEAMAAFAHAAPLMANGEMPLAETETETETEASPAQNEAIAVATPVQKAEVVEADADLEAETEEEEEEEEEEEDSPPPSVVPETPALPASEAQPVSLEMLSLLRAELGGIQQSFQEVLEEMPAKADAEAVAAAQEACADLVDRLAMAAEAVDLLALNKMLAQLSQRLRTDGQPPAVAAARLQALTPEFLNQLERYVDTPNEPAACAGLVEVLRHPDWQHPLSTGDALSMIEALADVVLTDEPTHREPRAQQASEDDVSLALPDDLDGMVLENLLQELPHQTQAFTGAIGRIGSGKGAADDVETAKRAAHTLKGAANTVGARGIANLTHHLEDILMVYSAEKALPGGATASLLIRAGDCLEAMNEALQGTGPVPDDAREVLQAVLDRANSLDEEGLTEEAPVEAAPAANTQASAATPERLEAAISMLRIPTHLADELLRLVGESITTNAQTQERLRVSLNQTRAVQAQNKLMRQLVGELDALVDIRGIAATQQQAAQDGGFDALEMQQYGELHTVTNRLMEAVTDASEITGQGEESLAALGETLEVQSRLQLESQDAVLRTRMVRVETVIPRLQRGVRQAARLLDKAVHLDVLGGDTLVDGQVLSELIDPLMHVLRNSVDHGIEAPDQRRAHKKNPTGQIQLTFSREGNNVLVRCQDDGHGLDIETIRTQATRLGLVEGTSALSDDAVTQLILVSGFSTRHEATQMSGRGIGMDIVNQRVLDLKGSLTLQSVPAKGLTVEIRIPLTMLSTHSLLVRVGKHTVAVSTRNIEDIHFVLQEQIKSLGSKRHYQTNQVVHDVVGLDELLNLPGRQQADGRTGFPILLVRQSQSLVRAVQVEEILETSNLVLKTLGDYVPQIPGVAGAAILGNGSVVPVVDLPDLLRSGNATPRLARARSNAAGQPTSALPSGQRRVLVVDDSLSARRATAQMMKDAGFEVRTAIDGLDATAVLEKFIPDLILADMEMPRMNGLELTRQVRRQASTLHVPVIMITSRSTEKHRVQAMEAGVNVYVTKPFNDDVLLNHVKALLSAAVA